MASLSLGIGRRMNQLDVEPNILAGRLSLFF